MRAGRRKHIGVAVALALLALAAGCTPKHAASPASAPQAAIEPQRAPMNTHPLAADRSPLASQAPPDTGTEAASPKKIVKIGLLLPLTGRNAQLGHALQDAATISLFDKYARLSLSQQSIKVQLVVKDTGDSPEFARAAAQDAVNEGVALIIGPIFSDATEVVAPIAAAKNISVLSFSNNRARAATGVYPLGFSPKEQVKRALNYAYAHDKKRIAVLVPRSPLGDQVIEAAHEAAAENEMTLAGEAQYAPQGIGVEPALAALMPGNDGTGALPFDTILLAEGGTAVDTVLRALSTRNINPATVQFIGTGIWDDVNLLRRVNLNGAWFASSSPQTTAQFEARFRANYNYQPPRIASLAYDAVALAVTLAASDRPFTPANLTGDAGFMGPANGVFRLRPTGEVERGLAVIEVQGSSLKVLSPAPTGFTK